MGGMKTLKRTYASQPVAGFEQEVTLSKSPEKKWNHTMKGRPTLYSEEMLDKAKEYIAECQDDEIERETKTGQMVYKLKPKLPTRGGLARYLGVARSTLYEWAEQHAPFSDIMEELGAEQEDRLINNGLSGDYNPTIAKVLLTKHGYREGIEQTGKDGKDLLPENTEKIKDAANKLNALYRSGSVPSDGDATGTVGS